MSSAAQLLTTIAGLAKLFHAPDGKCYADVPVDRHAEVWPIRSKRFKAWLARGFFLDQKKPPPTQAMAEAVQLVEAVALHGDERSVHVRVAGHDNHIYVDLVDAEWRAVEIDARGWRIIPRAPVQFIRAAGMLALPDPVAGGDLQALRAFLNVEAAADTWRLIVHWLVMALHPKGPYPVLALHGEQGAAKSTAARLLRHLVDPNAAPLRAEPREPRDLMIAASHGWVIALDNVSSLPAWLSDALCRLATGGGFSARELYTDDDEVLFAATRPIVLNGIEEVATRGDLMSRALLVELPTIAPERRREEEAFWAAVDAARPALVGALLDAVAGGLRESPRVQMTSRPRMADFFRWAVAVEQGLGWTAGEFAQSYEANITDAHEVVVESSAVAQAVRALVAEVEWSGTVEELLVTLTNRAAETTKRAKTWPTHSRGLSGALRRLAPNLRALGVEVTFLPRTKRGRPVTLREGKQPSPPSPRTSSAESLTFPGDDRGDGRGDGDGRQARGDGDDGGDGHFPTLHGAAPTVTGVPAGGWEPDLEAAEPDR